MFSSIRRLMIRDEIDEAIVAKRVRPLPTRYSSLDSRSTHPIFGQLPLTRFLPLSLIAVTTDGDNGFMRGWVRRLLFPFSPFLHRDGWPERVTF
jgi:hypothetical protein